MQEVENVAYHFVHQRLGGKVVSDGLLFAVVGAQGGVVIRIGQAAHVKHEIGVRRRAVFEAEGDDAHQQAVVVDAYPLGDKVAQLLGGEMAGVDAVGVFAQGGEPFAFAVQAFGQGDVVTGEWVAAAGFGEAAQ